FVNGNVHNTIGPVLSALVEYTHTHFRNEEAMMAENGYPFSAEHHAAHEDLRGQVEDIRKRFEAGDTSRLGNEMLAFLHDWLYFHILEEDMSYRPFFEAKGLAKPRPPGETAARD
ncbi:MAG: bacteriohemerythrin, partial [Rhodospirillales bacterium]|nr:bacteriohemerythrin [Rhodospirillales bacterium]